MKCADARQRIEQAFNDDCILNDAAVQSHLHECELCRQFKSDHVLVHRLRMLKVPEPDPVFLDSSIARASAAYQAEPAGAGLVRRFAPAAAVLALGILIGAVISDLTGQGEGRDVDVPLEQLATGYLPGVLTETAPVLVVVQDRIQPVNILINSDVDVIQARITVSLEGSVSIEGYPDTRELSWNSDLLAGSNLLTLPLIMNDSEPGFFTVTYDTGDQHQSIRVDLNQDISNAESGTGA